MPWPTSVRILIVDDEPHMRSLISRILSNSGYAVEEAADAEAALKCWQRQSFHLVVTDWDLPGLNGGQLVSDSWKPKQMHDF